MYFYIRKKYFVAIMTYGLLTFGSCSQFPSKAIENISLALKDSKGNKKKNEKYNEEIPKPNKKILISNPYIILSEQHIANDKITNENSLLPKNQAMENNDLKEKSLTDIKMQNGIITTKPNQQLKDSYVLYEAHKDIYKLPTEDQIKANLDKFAKEDYEIKSLKEIKKAELILKDLLKSNLDKDISDISQAYESLLNYLFSFHSLLDKLNKTPKSRRYLIRQMQRVRPIIQKNLEEMKNHVQNAHNYWGSAKNMLKNAKDKLGESIYKRILNENKEEHMVVGGGFIKREKKRAKELAEDSLIYANSCIENTEKAIYSLQCGNSLKKEIEKL